MALASGVWSTRPFQRSVMGSPRSGRPVTQEGNRGAVANQAAPFSNSVRNSPASPGAAVTTGTRTKSRRASSMRLADMAPDSPARTRNNRMGQAAIARMPPKTSPSRNGLRMK